MNIGTVVLNLNPCLDSTMCLSVGVSEELGEQPSLGSIFFLTHEGSCFPHIQQEINVYSVYTFVLFNVIVDAFIVCIDIWSFSIPPCILVPVCYAM